MSKIAHISPVMRSISMRNLTKTQQSAGLPISQSRSITTFVSPSSSLNVTKSNLISPQSSRYSHRIYEKKEQIRQQSTKLDKETGPQGELIPSILSQEEYERISEEDMETLSENLGALCEEAGNEKWEVDYSSGVLTLSIPPHGTYVLNKQPPNQQIWISSPISGPCRFGYIAPPPSPSSTSTSTVSGEEDVRGTWTHFRRAGVTLGGMVEGELRTLGVGTEVGEGWTGVGIK